MDTQFNYNESNKNDIKQFFKHNGYVVIEDFLDTDLADRLFNFLATRPEFWWESSTVNDESWNGTNNVPYFEENSSVIASNKEKARMKFNRGDFSYDFDRLRNDHCEGCNCLTCNFTPDILHSKKLLDICKEITDNPKLGEVKLEPFYSRYKSGSFLSCHTDAINSSEKQEIRRLAVVFHLSKNWRSEYGGNLVIMEKNAKDIKKILTPKFNSICLMNVEEEGMPHYVDQVFDSLLFQRYAISMWY